MMASKRAFSSAITETDRFIKLSASAQALYFHAAMRADNEGVLDSPQQLLGALRFGKEDMRTLIEAGYVIPVDMDMNQIIVITDWFIHNDIRFKNGRSAFGIYHDRLSSRLIKDNSGKYCLPETSRRSPGELLRNRTEHNNNRIEQQQRELIEKYGVPKTVKELLREGHDQAKIGHALLLLDSAKTKVRNPGAWLRRAVEKNWTDAEAEKKEAARKENAEIAAAAREAMEKERLEAGCGTVTNDFLKEAMKRHTKEVI